MKLFLLPVWFIQLFTQAKSFGSNPIIGNTLLNRCGLHIIRLVLSHCIMRFRFILCGLGVDRQLRQAFYQDGFVVVKDVLPQEQFERIYEEVTNINAEVRECRQGDTLTHRIMIDELTRPSLQTTAEMLDSKKYLALHKFAAGNKTRPVSYIQTIKNHFVNGPDDPQKNLHSDTFHPTMKSWYFLDECSEKNGPFTYLPGSQRLSMARIKWEYRKSIHISQDGDRYSNNGSFRATKADLDSMGFDEPIALSVPANTLVIANTHGFHRRGDASERSMRTEIWSISRSNPFNPLPGVDIPALATLQNRALRWYRRHCDKKAEKRGAQSSWHIIDIRNTLVDNQINHEEREAA